MLVMAAAYGVLTLANMILAVYFAMTERLWMGWIMGANSLLLGGAFLALTS